MDSLKSIFDIQLIFKALYKVGEKVKLKKENMVFETTIIGVDHKGFFITNNSIEQQFQVGDVEWVWD